MRSNTATAGRVRLVITLSVASAVAIMLGAILVVASTAVHLLQGHPAGRVTSVGLALSIAGLAVGLVTLLVFAFSRVGRSKSPGRSRPSADAGDGQLPAGRHKHAASSGAQGREQARAGTPQQQPPAPSPTPMQGARDGPQAARAPRATGPPGAAPALLPYQPAPYQPGARPAGPSRVPAAPGGYQSQRPPPPRQHQQRPAPRASERVPLRDAVPPRAAPPSRPPPPSRPAPPPREGPLGASAPRAAMRPGGPWPPRDLPNTAQPGSFGPGPASGSARPPGGPGYVPPAGPPPAGGPGSPGPSGNFDGGYAQVIRAADYPVPPPRRIRPGLPARPGGPVPPAGPGWPEGRRRPADPGPVADANVYVYRETGEQPGDPPAGSPAHDPAERDAAYWYDLLSEDPAPMREATRGPFEPLVSSDEPQRGAAQLGPAELDTTGPIGTGPDQPPAGAMRDQDLAETADARARKLERIKDFYRTAEAIGEQNVDKHFDQLLAQQRELISDYFRQPAPGQAAAAQPTVTGPRDGRADAPEGAGLAAEPPRGW